MGGVQKAGRYLQQKLCPFVQRVSLNRLAIKRTHNVLNIISNTLNTQYHIEICDNLSQEVFGKHISMVITHINSILLRNCVCYRMFRK